MKPKTILGVGAAFAAAAAIAWFLTRDRGGSETGDEEGVGRAGQRVEAAPILEGPRGTKPPAPAPPPPSVEEGANASVAHPQKESFSGRVVDEAGNALAGVALRLVWGGFERAYRLANGNPVPEDVLHALSAREVDPGARAVTNADGRFTIRGAGDRLVSESAAWLVDEIASPGSTVGSVTARPGFLLTATAVDASTGKAVEQFEGHARWSGHAGSYVAFDGKDGRAEIRTDRWWGPEDAAIVDLAIEAMGYVPVQVPVRYARGEAAAAADVRLVPLRPEDMARTTIEVVDAAGKPFDADWVVRIVDPRDSTQTIQDFAIPERVDAGRYFASLPPGRWTILVKANDWLGFLRWAGEVDLRTGENQVRAKMAPHGTLLVRWPAAWTARGSGSGYFAPLSIYPPDGSEGSGVGRLEGKTEFRSTTCLEGDWRVEFDAPMPVGRLEKNVRVRADEETVVEFRPP